MKPEVFSGSSACLETLYGSSSAALRVLTRESSAHSGTPIPAAAGGMGPKGPLPVGLPASLSRVPASMAKGGRGKKHRSLFFVALPFNS